MDPCRYTPNDIGDEGSNEWRSHLAEPNKRFQILSLDGGGIKGIFSAAILAKIEEDLEVNVVDHFDLIAGTSTGGIIAIGLGLGLRPSEILKFYTENGSSIFSWPRVRNLLHPLFRKYSRRNLEDCLRSDDCFGAKKFGQSKKRLIIPSYSLTNNDIYLFRTAHAAHLHRDYKADAVDVALATSAAPTYFSSFKIGSSNRLVDGGVWANNPIMVALTEAVGFLDANLSDVYALSLGTTSEVVQRPSRLNWGGLAFWAKTAPDVIMAGQSIAAANQAEILLTKNRFLRINATVAANEFALDRSDFASELMGKAEHVSRTHLQSIKGMFLAHKAADFIPMRQI